MPSVSRMDKDVPHLDLKRRRKRATKQNRDKIRGPLSDDGRKIRQNTGATSLSLEDGTAASQSGEATDVRGPWRDSRNPAKQKQPSLGKMTFFVNKAKPN